MSSVINVDNNIRVLLVDDHAVLRKGVATLLDDEADISIIGEAGDGEQALAMVKTLMPDLVVMDITMPKLNGIDATRQITAQFPGTKVIALSIHSAKHFVDDMLNAGASGYLLKESVPEELLLGIRAVMRGDMYLSSATTGAVLSAYVDKLSDKQVDEPPPDTISILQTKLHRPPITPDQVVRKHLLDRLEAERNLPLTLVSAPAGYGKSVLISSWLAQSEWPSAWLSLDADDSDLRQFLLYLVAAVRRIFPRACEASWNLAKSPQLPPFHVLAASIINELDTLDQPFILVLDDYHHIDVQSPANELLQLILEHIPIPLHLVIITRRDPALPLVTLRANGQVNEIRMQELQFDTTETRALLKIAGGFTVSDDALVNLQQELEGWAVGLRLMSLAMRRTEDPEEYIMHLQGGLQQTQEYMIQEVIAGLPARLSDCLLKSAIFDRFCEPLCHAVCAEESDIETSDFNGSGFIQPLRDDNLFIIPLDNNSEWFRYHHLFQRLLQNELKRHIKPDELSTLHKRAATWFESQGHISEAVQHSIKAGDMIGAAEVVERHRQTQLDQDQWHIVERWIALLPDDIIQQRPRLLLTRALALYQQYRMSEIPPILKMVESLIDNDSADTTLLGEVNFYRGFTLAIFEGKPETALHHFDAARKQLPMSQRPNIAAELEVLEAVTHQMLGDANYALRLLDERIGMEVSGKGMYLSRLFASQVFIHILSGNLIKARSAAQKFTRISKKNGSENSEAWSRYLRANADLQSYRLDDALQGFLFAVEKRNILHHKAAIETQVGLVLTYQAMRRVNDAERAMAKLMEFAIDTDEQQHLIIAQSCRARLSLLQGDLNPAVDWALAHDLESHMPSMVMWLEVPVITWARIMVTTASHDSLQQASEMLKTLRQSAGAMRNTYQTIDLLALHSLALEKLGHTNEALEVLQQAIELAQPGDWIRPFVELGHPMAKLLDSLAAQDGVTDYLQHVLYKCSMSATRLAAIPAGEPRSTDWKTGSITEPLTKREYDILKLLAERLQNKEIAARLFVSPETVKSHLKHLYQKLQVSNRRDAATKAITILAGNESILRATKDSPPK